MFIRKARITDAEQITECLLLAMEEIICYLSGKDTKEEALQFLHRFVTSANNQYSWQNCWVATENEAILGAINIYDGARLQELRQPIIEYIAACNGSLTIEDETEAGEYYIDSLGVLPGNQGKGIGSALLKFAITEYVIHGKQKLGLLVDLENPGAQKLYRSLGFQAKQFKIFLGKKMEHLQYPAI